MWASGSGWGKIGGSRKKFSGRERRAKGRVRLHRARGSAELSEVASGSAAQSLWLRNGKAASTVLMKSRTAASTWWCGPRTRLGWVEMAVGLPEGPSYPGHSPIQVRRLYFRVRVRKNLSFEYEFKFEFVVLTIQPLTDDASKFKFISKSQIVLANYFLLNAVRYC